MKDNKNKSGKHTGSNNSSPYPVSRLAPGFNLVDMAREIEHADNMIHQTSHAKLKVIAEQMLSLKQKARDILEEAQLNQQLHHAECQFKKIPGKTYHLYKKSNGSLFFSMLSPKDWGNQPSNEFQGSYTLQADMSWTLAEQTDDIDLSRLIDSL